MTQSKNIQLRSIRSAYVVTLGLLALVAVFCLPQSAAAAPATTCTGKTWNVNAGAETPDEGVQADGFFPNEVWVLENDCIQWTFVPKNEVHTVTFLTPGENRPQAPPPVGPPAGPTALPTACYSPVPTSYSGTCASSGALADGQTFTLTFPTPGNYKLVCLVHTDMTGTVHVLPKGSSLPFGQFDYDRQSRDESERLLSDDDQPENRDRKDRDHDWDHDDSNRVLAGTGEIVATGGGTQYRAVVRFLPGTIRIHAGESVVWTNIDPTEPHTITFGTEPALVPTLYSLPPTVTYPAGPPLANPPPACSAIVTTDCVDPYTGTVLATVNCTSTATCEAAFPQNVGAGTFNVETFINSGFVQAQAPDRVTTPQLPPGTTRIKISFPYKGTYFYHCALHDVDGMNGVVIVE